MNVLPEVIPAFTPPVSGTSSRQTIAECVPVNPLEQPGWDAMVAEFPGSSFFHSVAWARVLRDTYGHVPLYFTRLQAGRMTELLPVMEVASVVSGRRGVTLPFTDFCPPLKSEAASADVFERTLAHGRRRGWKYFECRGGVEQWPGATVSLGFHGHIVNLEGDEKTLFARTESAVRRGIRKAEQAGLRVKFENSVEAMRTYYGLHCQTRKRHGLPPQPWRFFENISRHVIAPGQGWVISAQQNGETVAAAIFFHFGSQAIYKYGASDYAFQNLRPNNLLMWEAIKWYATHGCKSLHLGRTSLGNDGLRRFKLGFGAQEERIEYCRYDFSRSAFVTDVDRVEGWFNTVFRALPQPLLRLAGATLYPHLS